MQRALLILLVTASYALLAGARPWTVAPLLTIAAAGALAAPRRTFSFSSPSLDRALVVVMASVALQLLPLPATVVGTLATSHDRIRSSMSFATDSPAWWATISLAPAATAWSLSTVILGVLAFWMTRGLCSGGGHVRALCRALTVIGSSAAVLAVLQKAVAPRLIMFAVPPDAPSASPFGAFVNRNHMAAWLLLVAMPVAGYLIARLRIHSDARAPFSKAFKDFLVSGTALTVMALMLMVGVLLLTLSRSGLIGLGVAGLTGWMCGRARVQTRRTSTPAVLGMLGAVLLTTALFVDVDGWATRVQQSVDFSSDGVSRTQIWKESMPVARDFWLTGTGAGTFSSTMTHYQQTRMWVGSMQRWAHFNNAHSHYVQLLTEGGVLLVLPVCWAIVAFAALAWRAIAADKGEMFWVRAGAAAALAGIAAQSVWETSLIMPPNAVMAGVAAGLVAYRRGA